MPYAYLLECAVSAFSKGGIRTFCDSADMQSVGKGDCACYELRTRTESRLDIREAEVVDRDGKISLV